MRPTSLVLLSTIFAFGYLMPACYEFGGCRTIQADEPKNDRVRITAMEPAVIVSGVKSTLKVRGFQLKEATELRMPSATLAKAEITEKKDAGQPKGLENKLVGDTQLLAEITLPSDHPSGILQYVVATPAGDATSKILVLAADALIDEIEPNNGFREAQKFLPGQSARGRIQGDKDVDVYAFPFIAGQQYRVSVTTGGPLLFDAELYCYNAQGQFLGGADDAQSRDPVLTLKSPVDGTVFLCVNSVHDIGGEWHSYLLTVEEVK